MAVAKTGAAPAARKRPADVPVVEFKDVTKVYDGGSGAVQSASMRIGRGEFVFLVGPTGCGKSTCNRLLMKELEPTRGEISIAGRELVEPSEPSLVSVAEHDGELYTRWRFPR